ncbi:MAG TPA: phenylalanine--tRNA ligase subunit beta, partial [Patescibacteria group bacterium]|nr:phenylalanine--tRNA ligase subunit beta [Patescibacteria group bacterium]
MDIRILDSHLREHLQTNAKPLDIAKAMSLTSASIERVEPFGKDWVYSAEITTNRPDMANVRGLAREAATVLPEFGFSAKLLPLSLPKVKKESSEDLPLNIKVDEKLVNRVCGIVMEVVVKDSPKEIQERLEAAGIRSLNNLIDVTNYVMLEIGHPAHVFDYDRLKNHTLIIRESKKGETIITLDKKHHTLPGGDIVADNGEGEIIDLLGIMGTDNSVVTNNTKRILFFFDNNDPWKIRKTSMGLAIRTEAAALNEKGIDPELAMEALLRGVGLYKEIADAKVISEIIDIYPHQPKAKTITVENERIQKIIGVDIPTEKSVKILESLGFSVKKQNSTLHVQVPSWREKDVEIAEDVAEEVARMYGYHNIPSFLPPFEMATFYHQNTNQFFWENRVKEMLKYWGFIEVYTYSMVSEKLFEGPLEEAVTLSNPLDQDHVYMRSTLTPSLLEVLEGNKGEEHIMIFEIANTYKKNKKGHLPIETRVLSLALKGEKAAFYHAKGYIEQLTKDMGIEELT